MKKNTFLILLAIGMLFTFNSCARKIPFETSSVVPAAEGFTKVTRDKNNNYVIEIDISNLAEVGRLQPSRNTYVVWIVTDQEMARNIGQLHSSSGTFSKKLKASFKSVSSSKPTKIFITAEDDEKAQYPGMQVVLSTDKF
jgi:predicted small lipoprotein YifL